MDVIHLHVGIISRGKGGSAVASAAYRACEKLHNRYNGLTHDFTGKRGIVYKEIFLPEHVPRRFFDRQVLWNEVELKEKNRNSRLAREVEVSLPNELNRDDQIRLIRKYVQENFISQGMCADIAVHDKGDGNPHAHVMLTTRSIDENGNWLSKQHKNYILDANGNKVYDPEKKRYKCGKSIKINDWDDEGNVEKWRKEWAKMCNLEFERKGIEKVVTHESYELQGIDRKPTKHLGRSVIALEKQGIRTDRGNEYRETMHLNKEREERKQRARQRAYERSR